MKTKALLVLLGFFIGTPLILGQTEIPALPSNLNTQSPLSNLPVDDVRNSALQRGSDALPIETLNNAGLNTSNLTNANTSDAANALRSRLGNEGILNDALSAPIPNRNNAASLGQSLAQKTFPEEYQAAQGNIGHIESLQSTRPNVESLTNEAGQNIPSVSELRDRAAGELPSSTPSNFSTPTFSTPTLPAVTPNVDLPNTPSL